jgi:hypothetical protein
MVAMRLNFTKETERQIHQLCQLSGLTAEVLIERAIALAIVPASAPQQPSSIPTSTNGPGAYFIIKGIKVPVGMKLRFEFKGREVFAKIEPDGIAVEGIMGRFKTFSGAAKRVTGYDIDGWGAWKYLDDETGQWKSVNDLRGGTPHRKKK